MDSVEYMPSNAELRSYFLFFHDRPNCRGVTWTVAINTHVTRGDVIGRFAFDDDDDVDILAPVTGTMLRTYSPSPADLPHRPSVLLALFQPDDGRVPRGKNPWLDIREDGNGLS